MKKYENKNITIKQMSGIVCDVCKKEYTDILDLQEFLSFSNVCGFGSIFGDSNKIEIDICQVCIKNILGKYIVVNGDDQDEL